MPVKKVKTVATLIALDMVFDRMFELILIGLPLQGTSYDTARGFICQTACAIEFMLQILLNNTYGIKF